MSLDVTRRRLHGYEYTPAEQAAKDAALRAMARDAPNSCRVLNEWIYDHIVKEVGEQEFETRMNNGYYGRPSKYKAEGGLLKTGVVCDPDGNPLP
jgi:hypothetical protein